jgi:hypothetical protein
VIANVGSRRADLGGHLQDRLDDGIGPVLANGVAAASDHHVAALLRRGSQACLQAGPVRPKPPWETSEHRDRHVGKGRGARRRSRGIAMADAGSLPRSSSGRPSPVVAAARSSSSRTAELARTPRALEPSSGPSASLCVVTGLAREGPQVSGKPLFW